MLCNAALRVATLGALLSLTVGCAVAPPAKTEDICYIFKDRPDWYKEASDAEERWDASIPVMMSIMHQESSFIHDARPPREKLLWVIPWKRPSTSYGYSQATNSTFDWYKKDTGNFFAQRDDFGDSIDFIGFYNDKTRKINGHSKTDARMLYHCYYNGHTGCKKPISSSPRWFKSTLKKVQKRAARYQSQLNSCRPSLKKSSWLGWW